MFGGLVWSSVKVSNLRIRESGGLDLEVAFEDDRTKDWSIGDSIAIDGVCLTIVKISSGQQPSKFLFEVSPETLSRTTLGQLKVGDLVHLEAALAVGDRIGGHMLSGHVDATAPVSKVFKEGDFLNIEWKLENKARDLVAPFLVEKGSVAVSGVSLTVNSVRDEDKATYFEVMLIPHTLEITKLGSLKVGDLVNIEADMLAKMVTKYAQRALTYLPGHLSKQETTLS